MAILLLTIATYFPVVDYDFVSFDDPFVTENDIISRGLSWEGMKWALLNTEYYDYWHPLSWLSHMLDFEIYGDNPGGHHLSGLIYHLLAVLALFAAIRNLTQLPLASAAVAGLFALHPVHVESVAWVVERKDVLSGLFFYMALFAYSSYVRNRSLWKYALLVLLFTMALAAKPMALTLPFVLLLLDYWPLERYRQAHNAHMAVRRVITLGLEKAPLFVLGLSSALFTFIVTSSKGALSSLTEVTIPDRAINAVVSYGRYVVHLLYPLDLAVLYPFPNEPNYLAALAVVVCWGSVVTAAVTNRKRHPYALVGILWYFGTLFPVIGLVHTGNQALADRFLYMPSMGLYVCVVFVVRSVLLQIWSPALRRGAGLCLAVLTFAILPRLTRANLSHWRSSEDLFRHAARVTKNNHVMLNNLALVLAEKGQRDEAYCLLLRAVNTAPHEEKPVHNLGVLLLDEERPCDALLHLQKAVELAPSWPMAHVGLARAYRLLAMDSLANQHIGKSCVTQATDSRTLLGAGMEAMALGDRRNARKFFTRAAELNPQSWLPHEKLGRLAMHQGSIGDALVYYKKALAKRPRPAYPYSNAGLAMLKADRPAEAAELFGHALAIDPDLCQAAQGLALALRASAMHESADSLWARVATMECSDTVRQQDAKERAVSPSTAE